MLTFRSVYLIVFCDICLIGLSLGHSKVDTNIEIPLDEVLKTKIIGPKGYQKGVHIIYHDCRLGQCIRRRRALKERSLDQAQFS